MAVAKRMSFSLFIVLHRQKKLHTVAQADCVFLGADGFVANDLIGQLLAGY